MGRPLTDNAAPGPRRLLAAALLALPLLLTACPDEQATILYVAVNGKQGIAEDPTSLTVTFSNGGQDFVKLFTTPGLQIKLPTSFVVRADGLGGAASVTVLAKDDKDRLLGQGQASATLVPDGQVDLQLDLYPADFPVNDTYVASQTFSFGGPSGRQLGSDSKGNFVVVWVDETCPLQRCDVWYRLFDAEAHPRLNGLTNTNKQFQANSGNAEYDMPAVAVRDDGNFVVAWQRYNNKTTTTREIRSRAFLANGAPDTTGGTEIQLSGSTATDPGSPDIVALRDNHYLVVWNERDSTKTKWMVMGRLLGPNGLPTKIFNGKNEPFLIAEFTGSSAERPEPALAPRNDPQNAGFMVVWAQDSKLWGRAYRKDASPINATSFNISSTGKVDGINIADMTAGYGVIWSDGNPGCGPDTAGTCIRFRRYDFNGNALEDAWVLNTTYPGDQLEPALARLPKDGSLLAAWTSTQDTSEDPKGGIRGRKILSNGLPVGAEFTINTTRPKEQTQPTVAAHGASSFTVVFRDKSELGPDVDEAAIRGQVVHATFGTRDGEIGALCDKDACKGTYSCQNTLTGKRCIATCGGTGSACPHGGKCQTLSVGGSFCRYD